MAEKEDIFNSGIHSRIILPDGSVAKSSHDELFERADFLAANYGIGGHKSFTEFVAMVNEEDPIIISGLINAAVERMKAMYGVEDKESPRRDNVGVVSRRESRSSKNGDSFEGMMCFLAEMGATKEELEDVLKKKKEGKLVVPKTDYSWITSEELMKPDFPLKEVLRQMKQDREKCVNIKVSESKRQAKIRLLREQDGKRRSGRI